MCPSVPLTPTKFILFRVSVLNELCCLRHREMYRLMVLRKLSLFIKQIKKKGNKRKKNN